MVLVMMVLFLDNVYTKKEEAERRKELLEEAFDEKMSEKIAEQKGEHVYDHRKEKIKELDLPDDNVHRYSAYNIVIAQRET